MHWPDRGSARSSTIAASLVLIVLSASAPKAKALCRLTSRLKSEGHTLMSLSISSPRDAQRDGGRILHSADLEDRPAVGFFPARKWPEHTGGFFLGGTAVEFVGRPISKTSVQRGLQRHKTRIVGVAGFWGAASAGIAPDAAGIEHNGGRFRRFDADRTRSTTNCARCGQPCDRGPWREQLCNQCALELGQEEVARRRAAAAAAIADECKTQSAGDP